MVGYLYCVVDEMKKNHPPKIRSWVAIDAFLNRKAGAHGGGKKQKNKRARREGKRHTREDHE